MSLARSEVRLREFVAEHPAEKDDCKFGGAPFPLAVRRSVLPRLVRWAQERKRACPERCAGALDLLEHVVSDAFVNAHAVLHFLLPE